MGLKNKIKRACSKVNKADTQRRIQNESNFNSVLNRQKQGEFFECDSMEIANYVDDLKDAIPTINFNFKIFNFGKMGWFYK